MTNFPKILVCVLRVSRTAHSCRDKGNLFMKLDSSLFVQIGDRFVSFSVGAPDPFPAGKRDLLRMLVGRSLSTWLIVAKGWIKP